MSMLEPGVHDWVVHRRNVVRSVAARVPGIDAEEATSRALEKMIRIVSTGGTITDPAPYWRRAAVNEAISMTREQGRTTLVEDDTLDGLTPPAHGAELDAERQADAGMLRTALADLADDDRQILFDRHVHDKAVTDIATGLGVRPHAVTMRLRRAEERLAGAFAAAHAQAVTEPECRTTRAGMHDYLKGRMLPRRQHRLEVHMDGCADCTRAFIDVREVSWMLRDLGQHLVAGAVATGTLGAALATAGVGTVGGAATGPRLPRAQQGAVAAGVAAVLVLGGIAWASLGGQGDQPPAQTIAGPDTGTAPARPTAPEAPPPGRPAPDTPAPGGAEPTSAAAPRPEDVSEPAEPVIEQVAAPEPPAGPEPEPEAAEPLSDPPPADAAPDAGTDAPGSAAPPVEPAPEEPAAPAPEPEAPPAPEPPTAPEPPPAPEPPAEPEPPAGGPPGNPGNPNGKGPTQDNDQGPGNGNGAGPGKGPGAGPGKGPGHGNGGGQGNGNSNGNGRGNGSARTLDGTAVPATFVVDLLPVHARQAHVTD
ncbi:hypothetical protein ACIG47_24110 [Promicromonospora sp. NPDC052451]|uniref:hypothetical protein n=1 Tax=Promicromonospora sp. NPDC052451 TaxID=3364407 RepID=UPI0037CC3417